MELQAVRIDASDPAAPKVEVAGIDVTSPIDRAVLVIEPGVLPKLVIEMNVHGVGEGMANVVGIDTSELPSIKDWLSSLDPTVIEEAALEEFNGLEDGANSTGEAFLNVLKKLAP